MCPLFPVSAHMNAAHKAQQREAEGEQRNMLYLKQQVRVRERRRSELNLIHFKGRLDQMAWKYQRVLNKQKWSSNGEWIILN